MKAAVEQRQAVESQKEDTELTLSGGALLAIFFGLMLVCGALFGFGYSLGHRQSPPGQQSRPAAPRGPGDASPSGASVSSNAGPDAAPSANESAAAESAANPGADASASTENAGANFPPNFQMPRTDEAGSDAARPEQTTPQRANMDATAGGAPPVTGSGNGRTVVILRDSESVRAEAPKRTAAVPHNRPSPVTAPTAEEQPAPASPTPLMVQIAAISRQEDAQALARALRKHGFDPTVRHSETDNFYHVQVGPFSARQDAEAMRQRLLSEGYNAILK